MDVRDDGSNKIIRANRRRLREWLCTNISVQYSKRAMQIQEGNGTVTVHFQDGSSATRDMLVGADGIYSTGKVHDMMYSTDKKAKSSLARKHIFGDQDNFLFREPTAVISADIELFGEEMLYKLLHERIQTLTAPFKSTTEETTYDGIRIPPLRLSTLIVPALPAERVTLLGDAAHAMTPYKGRQSPLSISRSLLTSTRVRGEGGCHAIQDALSLARALTRINKYDDQGIKAIVGCYEKEMLERGAEAARLSQAAFAKEMKPQKPQRLIVA
ncbi:putative FAD-binding domain-containing protein [Seiridium cardinale]